MDFNFRPSAESRGPNGPADASAEAVGPVQAAAARDRDTLPGSPPPEVLEEM